MHLKKSDINYKNFKWDLHNLIQRGVKTIETQLEAGILHPTLAKELSTLAILGRKISSAILYHKGKIRIEFKKEIRRKP